MALTLISLLPPYIIWVIKEFAIRKQRIEDKDGVTKVHKRMITRILPTFFVYAIIQAFLALSLYLPIRGDEAGELLKFYHIVPFIPAVCCVLILIIYCYLKFNPNMYFKAMKKYCGYK